MDENNKNKKIKKFLKIIILIEIIIIIILLLCRYHKFNTLNKGNLVVSSKPVEQIEGKSDFDEKLETKDKNKKAEDKNKNEKAEDKNKNKKSENKIENEDIFSHFSEYKTNQGKENITKINNYIVKFDLDGGKINNKTSIPSITINEDLKIENQENPTKEHYIFDGWIPNINSKITKDTTFKAKWKLETYKYTYKLNGGNINGKKDNIIKSGTFKEKANKLEDPVKEHYIFEGWNLEVPSKFEGNKTFTATWKPVNYTITYNLNGGTYNETTGNISREVEYDTMPEDITPTREHYTFEGWTPTLAVATENQTYTALWDPVIYTYIFELEGGNIDGDTEDVELSGAYNTDVTNPQDPTKEHYTFEGWDLEVPSKFEGDKTFTAQWTPVTYTYTFKLDGGKIDDKTEDIELSGEYNTDSSTPKDPVKEHYTFEGWNLEVPSKFEGNKTFIATWKAIDYTITYNLNGGTYNETTGNISREVEYDTMPEDITPTREHYTFEGWTPTLAVATENQTYTALWEPVTYTYIFELEGGNIDGDTDDVELSGTYNTNSSTPQDPTKEHYTFEGWDLEVPSTFEGNKTFIATWKAIDYTITYNLNGGTYNETTGNISREVEYNTMPEDITPTREHYTFSGWSPTIVEATKDTTYIALWTVKTYLYTFDLNGGNIDDETGDIILSGTYITDVEIPKDPVREHYRFKGWSLEIPNTFIDNIEFTAIWEAIEYTYTFRLEGGNVDNKTDDIILKGIYGDEITYFGDPERENYDFIGWDLEFPTTYTENKTYTAVWEIKKYTITYNLSGGTHEGAGGPITVEVEHGKIPEDIALEKDESVFIEWIPALEPATEDTTYEALWSIPFEYIVQKNAANQAILIPIKMASADEVAYVSINIQNTQ